MQLRKSLVGLSVLLLVLMSCGPAAQATPTPGQTPTTAPTSGARATPTAASTPIATGGTPAPTATRGPTATPASTGPTYGGTIRHPQREDPPSWDPVSTHVDPMMTSRNIAYSKLFTLWSDPPASCKPAITPVLVKDWKWLDATTIEMTLKPGIKFQNKAPVSGREMVAQDVVASMERYRNLPYMVGVSSLVKKVDAVDKYTFRIQATQPWGGLVLELLAVSYGFFILPPEAGGPKGDLWSEPEKSWIGSGPFTFDKWTPGVKWTFNKNPDYWAKGKPYVDRLEYVVMPEASTQAAALRSGQININRDLNELQVQELTKSMPGLEVVRCPSTGIAGANMLYMNTSGPPFDDVRVRRAVAMAIDHQAIIDTQYLGKAAHVAVLFPSLVYSMEVKDFPADTRQYLEYHPDRSKALLADAGYASGFKTRINFTARYAAPATPVAEMVVSMLQNVGIQAELKMLEYGQFSSSVLQAKYPVGEMGLTPGKQESPEDGQALRSISKYGGTANRSLVKDAQYDKLYDEFITSILESTRADVARQLQVLQASQAYRVILPIPDSTMVGRPEIRNLLWLGGTRDYGAVIENVWIAR